MKKILLVLFTFIMILSSCETQQINSFEECVAAGNPVMESYPRKCSANGQTFTEQINTESIDIVYKTYGAFTLREYQIQILEITSDKIQLTLYGADNEITAQYSEEIEQSEYERIVAVLEENNFQNLEAEYTSDVPITDVGVAEITVNGKTVKLDPNAPNLMPENVENIANELNEIKNQLWDKTVSTQPADVYNCTDEEKAAEICTREYRPVCGDNGETYSNGCVACSSGEIDSYEAGACGGGPQTMCEDFNGRWIESANECEGISEEQCNEIGGSFNECASACRNDPDAEICTMQCVQVCSI